MTNEKSVSERLAALPAPEVTLNYVGRVDAALAESEWFAVAPETAGSGARDPSSERTHLIDILAGVRAGRLETTATYGGRVLEDAAVEQFVATVVEGLRGLLRLAAV